MVATLQDKFKPLGDRVLVKQETAETKTQGGIIIPESAQQRPNFGEVMAVGPGTKDHQMTVKVGDRIIFGKYSGTTISIDGADYLIMRESDIFAIV